MKLWRKFSPDVYDKIPKGITITEFYDLLDIANSDNRSTNFQIQKEASKLLTDWEFKNHHTAFVKREHEIDAPILTTNFDLILTSSLGQQKYNTYNKFFTYFNL